MQISKWGNSLAVRLPKSLLDSLNLSEGDEIEMVDRVGLTLVIEKQEKRKAALSSMAKRDLKRPPGYKFNRDEANER